MSLKSRTDYQTLGRIPGCFAHSTTPKKMVSLTKSTECKDKKFRPRIASKERSFCVGRRSQASLIMFIGDRGTCVGYRLKGHLKYGGKWKPELHAASSTVHFTNEHKTSQTCMYCFGPLAHPKRTITYQDGKSHQPIQSRDKTSALAIVISDLSNMIFNEPLPASSPKPSQSHTGIFSKTNSFCTENENRGGSGTATARL
ncbi:hypothetical protein [Parasitella parasitica]|uniref:Uncharacterized protein n=1 Tax=Parasitella parasitica TaxID=35722 RepID=A0A0B7N3V4_9FUNG|nr:hypothetical protein [Parasitella parasitica]